MSNIFYKEFCNIIKEKTNTNLFDKRISNDFKIKNFSNFKENKKEFIDNNNSIEILINNNKMKINKIRNLNNKIINSVNIKRDEKKIEKTNIKNKKLLLLNKYSIKYYCLDDKDSKKSKINNNIKIQDFKEKYQKNNLKRFRFDLTSYFENYQQSKLNIVKTLSNKKKRFLENLEEKISTIKYSKKKDDKIKSYYINSNIYKNTSNQNINIGNIGNKIRLIKSEKKIKLKVNDKQEELKKNKNNLTEKILELNIRNNKKIETNFIIKDLNTYNKLLNFNLINGFPTKCNKIIF